MHTDTNAMMNIDESCSKMGFYNKQANIGQPMSVFNTFSWIQLIQQREGVPQAITITPVATCKWFCRRFWYCSEAVEFRTCQGAQIEVRHAGEWPPHKEQNELEELQQNIGFSASKRFSMLAVKVLNDFMHIVRGMIPQKSTRSGQLFEFCHGLLLHRQMKGHALASEKIMS